MDNWALLEEMWPVGQRPAPYRKKKVVRSLPFSELLECKRQHAEQAAREGKAVSLFGADGRLPTERFEKGKDNRRTKIHPASLVRMPIVEPDEYWDMLPVAREPVFRNVPLKHLGGESLVNELVIVRMHNR